MGLFSRKSKQTIEETPKPAMPVPGAMSPEQVASAKAFMAGWPTIVGQASDAVFWEALARFGRIGDATQAANTHSGNLKMFKVAESRFNRDFRAFLASIHRSGLG